jgi:hypothetical protein
MPNPEILIASAPHADTFGYSMPPPGLLRLGGALRASGHRVELCDLAHELAAGRLPADDRLAAAAAERLTARGPAVLGLSVMGATLPIALAIASEVRRRAPAIRLLLGGPGTTGIDVPLLERFAALDGIVRGEGEGTLAELLAAWLSGRQPLGLPGTTLRDGRGCPVRGPDRRPIEDLSTLPPYAFDLLPSIAEYKAITGAADGLVPIDSGRGCVYDCSFCTIGRFWGRRSRPLPVERLVDEIAAVAGMPGGRSAYLCHDLFGADRRHALELCRRLQERGVRVPFEIRARLDHLDDELLEALAAAGCYRVLFGIESADGAVRNLNHKRMAADFPALERLRAVLARGIVPILSLILGLPGEDDAALEGTLELALRASLLGGVHLSFHLVNPQPGCGLGESHGADARPVEGIPPDMALGAGLTGPERELIAAHPDLFSTFALLTGLPGGVERLRELHRISTELAPLLERYPKTVALLVRRHGGPLLPWFRGFAAAGRSLAAEVAGAGEGLIGAVFEWEQARLREAARASAPSAVRCLRPRGQLLRLPVDPSALQRALDAPTAEPFQTPPAEPRWLLVQAGPKGVRSLALGEGLAQLLARLDGRSLDELETELPGLSAALPDLLRRGLVEAPLPAAAERP